MQQATRFDGSVCSASASAAPAPPPALKTEHTKSIEQPNNTNNKKMRRTKSIPKTAHSEVNCRTGGRRAGGRGRTAKNAKQIDWNRKRNVNENDSYD